MYVCTYYNYNLWYFPSEVSVGRVCRLENSSLQSTVPMMESLTQFFFLITRYQGHEYNSLIFVINDNEVHLI